MENLWKVFSRIRRLRGKYFSVHDEYDEVRVVCGIVGPKNSFSQQNWA
jgi:hypothetical protein